MLPLALALAGLIVTGPTKDFISRQNGAGRVKRARANRAAAIRARFAELGLSYPAQQLLLRVLKREERLEVWGGDAGEPLALIGVHRICAKSGQLGPKRREGDAQVPEGFYRVERFNAWSSFHLSLGIDYPNASDRVLSDARQPGSDIFIHGSCVTIGCVPIGDEAIEQVYLIALDTFIAGQPVNVHLFPGQMDDDGMAALRLAAGDDADLLAFWDGLRPGYLLFAVSRRLPRISVDAETGAYRIAPVPTAERRK